MSDAQAMRRAAIIQISAVGDQASQPNLHVERTANKRRLLVPSALRASTAAHVGR